MRSSSEESECAICLENKTCKVALLSCGHTYHYKCIEDWVNQKQNLLRCCCICEKNTEIVNIIGEDDLIEESVNNTFIDNNVTDNTIIDNTILDNTFIDNTIIENTNLINNRETHYYYDDSYFPNYSTRSDVYVNNYFSRNRVAPEPQNQYIERRNPRPGFFDILCCNIL